MIVGLGNPGQKYESTRHNVGFMAVDALASRHSASFKRGRGPYFHSRILINNSPVLLIKPTTYMNLSGQAIEHAATYFKLADLSHLLIIADDFHLPFGTFRIRGSGSAGGQKGLKSAIQSMKTEDLPRLRIGIGEPPSGHEGAISSYVLSNFSKKEAKQLEGIIQFAADAAESFVANGIEQTMNDHNRNILKL